MNESFHRSVLHCLLSIVNIHDHQQNPIDSQQQRKDDINGTSLLRNNQQFLATHESHRQQGIDKDGGNRMNQIMKHFTFHQQCIPKMRFPAGILPHSSHQNCLTEIVHPYSNGYHQYSNNCFIKTIGNLRIYPPIYQDFVHPFS